MIEIKLSQGAKPGLGGLLPAAKVTPEIAAIRGIPVGVDCWSPSRHTAFHDADSLLDFVELLADDERPARRHQVGGRPARPVPRPRAAHGARRARRRLHRRSTAARAAPAPGRSCSPTTSRCRSRSASRACTACSRRPACTSDIVFTGGGKLGLPENALLAFALGCDTVNVGREAMLSIGCIQAQRCHTGRCPTGVTTNSAWLQRGLDPPRASRSRAANYLVQLRKELLQLSRACGVAAPGARHARPPRARRRPLRRPARRRRLRLRARLGAPVADRSGRAGAHALGSGGRSEVAESGDHDHAEAHRHLAHPEHDRSRRRTACSGPLDHNHCDDGDRTGGEIRVEHHSHRRGDQRGRVGNQRAGRPRRTAVESGDLRARHAGSRSPPARRARATLPRRDDHSHRRRGRSSLRPSTRLRRRQARAPGDGSVTARRTRARARSTGPPQSPGSRTTAARVQRHRQRAPTAPRSRTRQPAARHACGRARGSGAGRRARS